MTSRGFQKRVRLQLELRSRTSVQPSSVDPQRRHPELMVSCSAAGFPFSMTNDAKEIERRVVGLWDYDRTDIDDEDVRDIA